MTRKHETNEEIQRSITELEVLIKETGDLRESLGLPRKRKIYFVEYGHSREMIDRVRVVAEVLTSYLGIINDGKRLIPFPVDTLTGYTDILTLINHSEDMLLSRYGDALLSSIRVIQNEDYSYEMVVTKLYSRLDAAQKYLEMADDNFLGDAKKFEGTDEELDEIIADYQRHFDAVIKPRIQHETEVFAEYEASKGVETE